MSASAQVDCTYVKDKKTKQDRSKKCQTGSCVYPFRHKGKLITDGCVSHDDPARGLICATSVGGRKGQTFQTYGY